MGYDFGAGVGYGLTQDLSLIGSLDYNQFLLAAGTPGVNKDIRFLGISGNLKATFLTQSNLTAYYATAGMGYCRQWRPGRSADVLQLLLGAGMDVPAGRNVFAVLEGKYGICVQKGSDLMFASLKLGAKWMLE
jgi:hypothetical protein